MNLRSVLLLVKLFVSGLGISLLNSLGSERWVGLGSALGTWPGTSLGWLELEFVAVLVLGKLLGSGLGQARWATNSLLLLLVTP